MDMDPIDKARQDVDPAETAEWLEALDAVMEREGPERAHYLLETLVDKARRSGAYLPYKATTAYLNTIPVQAQEPLPGDADIEWRIRSIVRWKRWRWWSAPIMTTRDWAGTSRPSPPPPPSTTSASTISSTPRRSSTAATW